MADSDSEPIDYIIGEEVLDSDGAELRVGDPVYDKRSGRDGKIYGARFQQIFIQLYVNGEIVKSKTKWVTKIANLTQRLGMKKLTAMEDDEVMFASILTMGGDANDFLALKAANGLEDGSLNDVDVKGYLEKKASNRFNVEKTGNGEWVVTDSEKGSKIIATYDTEDEADEDVKDRMRMGSKKTASRYLVNDKVRLDKTGKPEGIIESVEETDEGDSIYNVVVNRGSGREDFHVYDVEIIERTGSKKTASFQVGDKIQPSTKASRFNRFNPDAIDEVVAVDNEERTVDYKDGEDGTICEGIPFEEVVKVGSKKTADVVPVDPNITQEDIDEAREFYIFGPEFSDDDIAEYLKQKKTGSKKTAAINKGFEVGDKVKVIDSSGMMIQCDGETAEIVKIDQVGDFTRLRLKLDDGRQVNSDSENVKNITVEGSKKTAAMEDDTCYECGMHIEPGDKHIISNEEEYGELCGQCYEKEKQVTGSLKRTTAGAYWVDPSGQEYIVPANMTHDDFIKNNAEEFGSTDMNDAIAKGWVRVRLDTDLSLEGKDVTIIPGWMKEMIVDSEHDLAVDEDGIFEVGVNTFEKKLMLKMAADSLSQEEIRSIIEPIINRINEITSSNEDDGEYWESMIQEFGDDAKVAGIWLSMDLDLATNNIFYKQRQNPEIVNFLLKRQGSKKTASGDEKTAPDNKTHLQQVEEVESPGGGRENYTQTTAPGMDLYTGAKMSLNKAKMNKEAFANSIPQVGQQWISPNGEVLIVDDKLDSVTFQGSDSNGIEYEIQNTEKGWHAMKLGATRQLVAEAETFGLKPGQKFEDKVGNLVEITEIEDDTIKMDGLDSYSKMPAKEFQTMIETGELIRVGSERTANGDMIKHIQDDMKEEDKVIDILTKMKSDEQESKKTANDDDSYEGWKNDDPELTQDEYFEAKHVDHRFYINDKKYVCYSIRDGKVLYQKLDRDDNETGKEREMSIDKFQQMEEAGTIRMASTKKTAGKYDSIQGIQSLIPDAREYEGYSGRGMYGSKSPFAFVTSEDPRGPIGEKLRAKGFKSDNMGMDYIYYKTASKKAIEAITQFTPEAIQEHRNKFNLSIDDYTDEDVIADMIEMAKEEDDNNKADLAEEFGNSANPKVHYEKYAKKKTASGWASNESVEVEFKDGSKGTVYYEEEGSLIWAGIEKNGEIIKEFFEKDMDNAIEQVDQFLKTASKKKTASIEPHDGVCDKCGEEGKVWGFEFANNPDRESEDWCSDCMTPKQKAMVEASKRLAENEEWTKSFVALDEAFQDWLIEKGCNSDDWASVYDSQDRQGAWSDFKAERRMQMASKKVQADETPEYNVGEKLESGDGEVLTITEVNAENEWLEVDHSRGKGKSTLTFDEADGMEKVASKRVVAADETERFTLESGKVLKDLWDIVFNEGASDFSSFMESIMESHDLGNDDFTSFDKKNLKRVFKQICNNFDNNENNEN